MIQLHFHISKIDEAEGILNLLSERGLLSTVSVSPPTLSPSAPTSAGRERRSHPLIEYYKAQIKVQKLHLGADLERAGYTGPASLAPLDLKLAIVAGKLAALGESQDKISELMGRQAVEPLAENSQIESIPPVSVDEIDDDDI